MSNPIEHFEFILRKHSSKRHLAFYNGNKQQNKQTHRPQDVISSVSAQLKAIQVADIVNKSVNRDLQKYKRSTFLCVNNLPLYEESRKQCTNTFDTQLVSNTQLINIMDDAELIEKHRGMTQEFETSFSHADTFNQLGGSTTMPPGKENTNKPHSEVETNNLNEKTHSGYCKYQYFDDNITKIRDLNDDGTSRIHSEEKYAKNNEEKYSIHKPCIADERIAKNKENIQETGEKYNSSVDVISRDDDFNDKIYITVERIAGNKDIIKETHINNHSDQRNNNIATDSEMSMERDTKHKKVVENETDNLKDDEMEQDISQILNECIEMNVNTQTYTERSPSPVFINKKVNSKAKSPSALVFNLDVFEKFENFALSVLEHNDFERAKHVINSTILERELHVKADVDLGSKDARFSPVLEINTSIHSMQDTAHKKYEEGKVNTDFLINKHHSYYSNKLDTAETQQLSEADHPNKTTLNPTQENNHFDNSNNAKYPIFSTIKNQSPIHSQILQETVKKKVPRKYFNNDELNTTHCNNLGKDVHPKDPKQNQLIEQLNISIINDEILFSSDEEDIHKEYQDLPFTCDLETSFYYPSDVPDRTMYVGFQTASNRSIQICEDSFNKAKSLLSGVDDYKTTVTDLVKICDESNRVLDNMEVEVVNTRENDCLIEIKTGEAEIIPQTQDKDNMVDNKISKHVDGNEFENIYINKGSINTGLINTAESSNHDKITVENSNNFDDFKTTNNKIINLSDKALARCEEVFQDIDLDEIIDTHTNIGTKGTVIKANFEDGESDINMKNTEVEFKDANTNANSEELIDNNVSAEDECLDDLIHNINDEVIIQEFENIEMSLEEDKEINEDGGFVGFKSASEKNIVISDEALAKTKNIFKDMDINEMDENYLKGHNSKINLAESSTDKINVDVNMGFKAASNKQIQIPDEAFCGSKNILQNIDRTDLDDLKNINIHENLAKINRERNNNNIDLIHRHKAAETFHDEDKINDAHVSVNNITGFKTANNKVIKVSKESLAKTGCIFKDIDSVQLREKTSMITNTGINKKDIYPNVEDLNQPSTSRASFAGFKFGNNKKIKVSNACLANVKDIFRDIDFNKEVNPVMDDFSQTLTSKASFPGLKTGKDTEIQVSNTSLVKDVETFNIGPYPMADTIENCNSGDINKPLPSKSHVIGFITASNREIEISKAALSKTRNIFNDIDSIDLPRKPDIVLSKDRIIDKDLHSIGASKTRFVGFKTGNNKEIIISDAALAKTKNIFNDIDDIVNKEVAMNVDVDGINTNIAKPDDNTEPTKQILAVNDHIFEDETDDRDNFPKVMPKGYPFQGFKTASNKKVNISEETLIKTKNIFKDIGTDDNLNIESEKLHSKNNNDRTSSFETARDNFVDAYKDKKSEKDSISIFKGFQTASNKSVTISEKALARSMKIFKELDRQENDINTEFAEDINDTERSNKIFLEYNHAPTGNKTELKVFQTGNSKVIDISEKALIASRKLLKGTSSFKGFYTVCEEKVGIPEQTLDKCRPIFQEIVNVDEINENVNKEISKTIDCGFKTANKQSIKVSENALVKSKKIFENSSLVHKKYDFSKEAIKVKETETPIEDISHMIDTQVLNNFEDTLYTEDFQTTPIKSKRSGSPILSCPKAKKRKKFETPYSQKPVKYIAKKVITVKSIRPKSTKIKYDANYKKDKTLKLKDLQRYTQVDAAIDPYLTKFTFESLLQFEFTEKRNDSSYSNMTIDLLKEIFLESVNAKLVPEGWIDNHIRLILWKLISYEIRYPKLGVVCNTNNFLNQLKYRYDRELYNAQRPALRKILERDDLSTKTIVLCVVHIYENDHQVDSVTNLTSNIELLLTDGWYCIKACIDKMIAKLVYDQKIVVGTKVVTNGAELMNCDQGMAPWEDTSSVRLKLSGNSTRRARWDARLGYHGKAAIMTRPSTVNVDGGKVSKLRVYVARVYPSLYVEKFEDGSTVTRSERLENLHQMKYETERQIMMEKLYEEVEKEFSDQESQETESYPDSGGKRTCLDSGSQIAKIMRKSNDPAEFRAQLTSSQSVLLVHHVERRREKLLQDVQARIRAKMEKTGMCVTRNVVPVKKIRVVGVEENGDAVEITKGIMSIWKPSEAILEITKEGAWINVMNVVPTALRYSEIQISAGRQSVFSQSIYTEPDKFKPYTKLLKRKCFTIKDLANNPTMSTDYNEIDTVGLVFLIDPSIREFETTKQLFQNVYITDGDKNIICVNFWGGLRKFGFENVLDTGQLVVCGNLQKRAGNTRKNIPQYRVTEFSYFTKTPKNECARIIIEELNTVFLSLDRRKFCDDCIILKNNYSVIKNYNIENISPYRPNNSDYNLTKNKQFIDSPLANKNNFNLTGLDFESTFKQRDTHDLSKELLFRKKRVCEKISKLKMYGEPPPLSHITILNKSKNAFNSYKSPLLSESGVSNHKTSLIPNLNSDSCTNVASIKITPQNMVVLNNSGHSPVLMDRTYVKCANPVKLNFDKYNDSGTDHLAEEFDGSPPLSLD